MSIDKNICIDFSVFFILFNDMEKLIDNVCRSINRDSLIKTFVNLVKIDSLSLKEKKFIDYLINLFKQLGLEVKFQKVGDSGNIIAILKGNKKAGPFFFNAHTDTVEPGKNIRPVVTDKLIKSDGTTVLGSDDKAAIAIFIEAIKIVKRKRLSTPDIYFVLTYAEEIGLEGAKHLDFSLVKCKYGYSLDADGHPGTIILSAPTHWVYEITVHGKSAHAGLEPEKGKNAIKIASQLIDKIKTGKLDNETTANIGKIQGGIATNIVPDVVILNGEVRSRNRLKCKKYIDRMKMNIRDIRKRFKTKIDAKFELSYKSYNFNLNDAIVQKVVESAKTVGIKPIFEHSNGGSDSNIFNQNGLKTLNLGIGMSKVHTKEEYIRINDLVQSLKLTLSLMLL